MKKIVKIFTVLSSVLALSGCDSTTSTIEEKRTIVLNVDSEVVPNFTSNFGSGTYDASSKKYTHVIDSIKDLYISLSYDDLKTLTVHIPTKDMGNDIITKNVSFGDELDAEVEVAVEGVKTLEGLQINNSLQYFDLKVGKKNTFKFKVPSREEDYNLKFTLPNYKEFDLNISKDDLVSGNAKVETVAVALDQIYIGIEGTGFEYKIYSMATNKVVGSGDVYSEGNTQFNVLPNDTQYYVEIKTYNGRGSRLVKVPLNENKIIDAGNNYENTIGYMNFDSLNQQYYGWRLYNKNKKIITNNSSFSDSISSYGLIVMKNDSEAFYLDDLESKLISQDSWDYKYELNYDDFVEVSFDITKIDLLTNEIISRENTEYFDNGYDVESTLENNVFHVSMKEIRSGYVTVDLYSKDNEKVGTVKRSIGGNFGGVVFSDTILHEASGKTIPYTIPVFLEDLVYDNGEYTHPSAIIDVDVSLVTIKVLDGDGNIETLSLNDYIMDENQEIIMGTSYGGNAYFEVYEGKTYTFKRNNVQYSFTVKESDIQSGIVLLISENAEKVQVKIPQDYYLVADYLGSIKFYPNNEGIVNLPKWKQGSLGLTLCNDFVSVNRTIYLDGSSLYEITPFYVLEGANFEYTDYMSYYANSYEGSNGIKYTNFDVYEGYAFPDLIVTTAAGRLQTMSNGYYKIPANRFTYNEEYQAYYYDMKQDFDHIIILEGDSAWRLSWGETAYYYSYSKNDENYTVAYVNDGMVIEYEGDSYTVTSNDSKYLKANIEHVNNDHYEIVITEANN